MGGKGYIKRRKIGAKKVEYFDWLLEGDKRRLALFTVYAGGDKRKGAHQMWQHQQEFWNAKPEDRNYLAYQYDFATMRWGGRDARRPRESLLLKRSHPDSIRNKLTERWPSGKKYLTSSETNLLFQELFGDVWKRKRQTAYDEGILKRELTSGLRYLWFNPPPIGIDVRPQDAGTKHAEYYGKYAAMPRRCHKPGASWEPEKSEVFAWMSEQTGNSDLAWLAAEYRRITRFGTDPENPRSIWVYDKKTRQTMGIEVWRAENPSKHELEKEAKRKELERRKAELTKLIERRRFEEEWSKIDEEAERAWQKVEENWQKEQREKEEQKQRDDRHRLEAEKLRDLQRIAILKLL